MKRIRVEEINGIIYIDGIDIIKKVSELSKENDRLYLENKRQKEVIDKIKDLLAIKKSRCLNENDYILNALDLDEILDILKEVEQ
jgi:hypothetical protein